MINDKFLSYELHKNMSDSDICLCLIIQLLTINIKNSLTNINYCDIIYSQTENAPREYFLGGTEMVKSNVESVIKKSSFILMVFSLLFAVFSVFCAVYEYGRSDFVNSVTREIIIQKQIYCYLIAAALVIAMIVFFRISKSGRPFTRGNIMAVRAIAGLFCIKAIVPIIIHGAELGVIKASIQGMTSAFIAILFIVFAEIMRYGNLLQKESDETL